MAATNIVPIGARSQGPVTQSSASSNCGMQSTPPYAFVWNDIQGLSKKLGSLDRFGAPVGIFLSSEADLIAAAPVVWLFGLDPIILYSTWKQSFLESTIARTNLQSVLYNQVQPPPILGTRPLCIADFAPFLRIKSPPCDATESSPLPHGPVNLILEVSFSTSDAHASPAPAHKRGDHIDDVCMASTNDSSSDDDIFLLQESTFAHLKKCSDVPDDADGSLIGAGRIIIPLIGENAKSQTFQHRQILMGSFSRLGELDAWTDIDLSRLHSVAETNADQAILLKVQGSLVHLVHLDPGIPRDGVTPDDGRVISSSHIPVGSPSVVSSKDGATSLTHRAAELAMDITHEVALVIHASHPLPTDMPLTELGPIAIGQLQTWLQSRFGGRGDILGLSEDCTPEMLAVRILDRDRDRSSATNVGLSQKDQNGERGMETGVVPITSEECKQVAPERAGTIITDVDRKEQDSESSTVTIPIGFSVEPNKEKAAPARRRPSIAFSPGPSVVKPRLATRALNKPHPLDLSCSNLVDRPRRTPPFRVPMKTGNPSTGNSPSSALCGVLAMTMLSAPPVVPWNGKPARGNTHFLSVMRPSLDMLADVQTPLAPVSPWISDSCSPSKTICV